MTTEQIQEELLTFICRNFIVELDEIELDESMIDNGIIDSFGLVEISAFIQKAFEIKVEDGDMIRPNFGSVLKIVDFVVRKQNS